ncbi:MAG TPA: 3'-5' exonuclease [Rhodoblastus sp.]|nr:3'-5' exonuclease [Rhodoblastus sp.]
MLPRRLKRWFHRFTLANQSYRFLFEPGPPDEVVVVDCETTGLDVVRDDIITIAAVKVRGNRILASEKFVAVARPEARMKAEAIKVHRVFEAEAQEGERIRQIMRDFLHFVGGRPLVGYYLEFDVAMIDKNVLRLIQIEMPNRMIEVSAMYYERRYGDGHPGDQIDLSFVRILEDLGIPMLEQHDALNDAIMTAEAYVALKDMKARGVRFPKKRD